MELHGPYLFSKLLNPHDQYASGWACRNSGSTSEVEWDPRCSLGHEKVATT